MKTGLLGAGGRGIQHAKALNASPRIDFIAVCDLDIARAQRIGAQFDIEPYDSAKEMLEREDIESVVIVTEAKDHANLSIQVLEAGKHVMCEKPMSNSVQAAQRMLEAARSSGLKAAIGYQRRFDPFFWTMKKIAHKLDPIQITLTRQRGLFLQRYLRSGSTYGIMDDACHHVDLANWLIGQTPKTVSGSFRTGVFTPTNAIDTANIQIEYGNNKDVRTANVITSMGGVGLQNFCQLVGKKGNAERQDSESIKITEIRYDEEAGEEKQRQLTKTRRVDCERINGGDPTQALEAAFADYVQGRPSEIANFHHGFETLLVLEAAFQSAKKCTKVSIAEVRPS